MLRITPCLKIVIFTLLTFSTSFLLSAQNKTEVKDSKQTYKITALPRYAVLNINNVSTWSRSDGYNNHSPSSDNGLYFPRSTAWMIYLDGILWGGKAYVDSGMTVPAPYSQLIRVGGSAYVTGTVEGRVTGFGQAAIAVNPADASARIYRIRRDYTTMTDDELREDAAEVNEIADTTVTEEQKQAVLAQYETDWNAWPVAYGAPFIDRNSNGVYDPPPAFNPSFTADDLISGNQDEPGIAGADPNLPADQVIWTVYNDLNRTVAAAPRGSEPFGLELQKTVWGYKRNDALGNVYFTRLKIINKGGVDVDASGTKGALYIDSMYATLWSDPDIGNAGDDLKGCDTLLGGVFTYNGAATDEVYLDFGLAPPSVGYYLMAGATVPYPGDTAFRDFTIINDHRNVPMTSFTWFAAGDPYSDPPGNYAQGVIRWYKMMRGFAPFDGPDVYYTHPPELEPGPFPLSGDPVAGTGWLDGQGTNYSFYPGDQRMLLNSGPFQLFPGDTQEVVFATVVGLGSDRLSSIAVMRFNAQAAREFHNSLYADTSSIPSAVEGESYAV
ncbi:MAG: hypothetical protein L0Y80_00720 [Ignavibacteriae bacterium]|nr:hypothetical protein [Ignavibacteriota bacterium]